ncbi:MAG: outer membrane lipoprotein carrier protein LolA [Parvibaculaceae bacterium]
MFAVMNEPKQDRDDRAAHIRHRNLLLAALAGVALLALALLTPLVGASAHAATLSPRDRADIDRITGYLNSIEHLQGGFLQVGPDGSISEGTFYLRRPGRLRFDYAPPVELLVVADGTWVIVKEEDYAAQRYPIGATPLNLLLASDVDLRRAAEVRAVNREPGLLRVTLADPSGEAPGDLTLVFDEPNLQLRQWIVRDAQGLQTTIALRNIEQGVKADNSLFTVRESLTPGGR